MAAPWNITMRNLSGIWVLSVALSDDLEPCCKLQEMPWIFRKLLSFITITNRITQTSNEKGYTQFNITSTVSGGFKAEMDPYVLDGLESPTAPSVQRVRAQWLDLKCSKPMSMDGGPIDPYLTRDWLEDPKAPTWDHVYLYIVNEKGGRTAEYVWGFAWRGNGRYFVKKLLMRKGERSVRMAIVQEWDGPLLLPQLGTKEGL
ncbi:hypothetical protein F4781DRAFT_402860 [Annulohypoxylon bovei var. microspora]|nr:hypothetical protein F4781DRAFT_402860 [Annulohypoxylon bovei var. microspora]